MKHEAARRTLVEAHHPDEDEDSLADLAASINAAHESVAAALKNSITHAMHAGELLIKAKQKLGRHGEWLSWLKANFPFSDRTARLYMQVARKRAEVEAKMATVADLPLRDIFAATESEEEPDAEVEAKTNRVTGTAAGNYRAGSGNTEWFTPPEILVRVRATLGDIALDPATCERAQRNVQAARYFTMNDDGLSQRWYGATFLNPPFAMPRVANFTGKLIAERGARPAILLTNNCTETNWFQQALKHADAICFPSSRIRFLNADGRACDTPTQGQALFYFGPDTAAFAQHFGSIGFVLPLQSA